MRYRRAPLDETLLRALFATPPSEFVAARNELAKSLRREKRRDEAYAIAALRRPGWDDWALNVAAAEHGDDVASFAAAATAVRDAQAAAIEGREGPDVRSALRELRDRTARLVRAATAILGRVERQAGGGELTGRLSEVAGNESAVEQLCAGVLGAGGEAAGDPFAGLQPAPDPSPSPSSSSSSSEPKPPSTVKPSSSSPSSRAEPASAAVDPAPVGAATAGRAEREERRRREQELQSVTRSHREATKRLARADIELDTAGAAIERAERDLAGAQQVHTNARNERDEAAEVLAGLDADLQRARTAVDDESADEA